VVDEARKAEAELVGPLLQFRNWGVQLDGHWSTTSNDAAFGTDYFTRTAVAKSNILVNAANETKYFYQDLDGDGGRLNGPNSYTMTFPKGQTPPGKDKEANWLPAPSGDFSLYLRAYWPKTEIVDGTWSPSPVASE
jgi:hypothetical protein